MRRPESDIVHKRMSNLLGVEIASVETTAMRKKTRMFARLKFQDPWVPMMLGMGCFEKMVDTMYPNMNIIMNVRMVEVLSTVLFLWLTEDAMNPKDEIPMRRNAIYLG